MAQLVWGATFMNQPDIFGVASFVAKCLALFPWFFKRFLVWLQAFFQASAQMPTRGIYSDVTLPYLTLPLIKKFGACISTYICVDTSTCTLGQTMVANYNDT